MITTRSGHKFASRLPEPQDEDKVFRFEQVRFHMRQEKTLIEPVDYVALSDGEHQQAQIFGVFSMITDSNALFVLDEPRENVGEGECPTSRATSGIPKSTST